jgi:hypothetical protein
VTNHFCPYFLPLRNTSARIYFAGEKPCRSWVLPEISYRRLNAKLRFHPYGPVTTSLLQ